MNQNLTNTRLTSEYLLRFGGLARLYGRESLNALHAAHFVVIGLGGVGSWAAEALARSGIGELTLIELDDVCITNTNRQSHALKSTVGRTKNSIVHDRLKDINPEIILHQIDDFLAPENMTRHIGKHHQVVIDDRLDPIKSPLNCLLPRNQSTLNYRRFLRRQARPAIGSSC